MNDLASLADMDVEEVLVTLWYADIEYVTEPTSRIRSSDVNAALRACGLAGRGDRRRKSYWAERLGLNMQELEALLRSEGFTTSPNARNVPKGAQGRLERHRGVGAVHANAAPNDTPHAAPLELPQAAPIEWRTIGQKRATSWLTVEEVESIHQALENDADEASDPIWPPGVKNADSLASALMRPHTGAGIDPKYPTVEMAAAALVHSLVHNHPFHNGNKRTALVAMLVFLDRNNQWLRDSVDKAVLFRWILGVTNHRILPRGFIYDRIADREVLAMADWIRKNSRAISRSERPITWRKLQSILERDFSCDIESRTSGVVIRRAIRERGFLGRPKVRHRTFQFFPGGDGREIGPGTIKQMRRELHLDEAHEIDSVIFYGDERSADDFIRQYRALLRALARV